MITLRYHIVSITAVFLALGLGLTMGSAFLDRATVETLEGQLSGLETDLRNSNDRIGELESALSAEREEAELFAEQGVGPLLDDELTGIPVMVFAVRGTDETKVDRAQSALSVAGAEVDGTWWITDRFALDDEAERRDLATALAVSTDLETRLRRTVTQQLSLILLDRMEPVTTSDAPTETPDSENDPENDSENSDSADGDTVDDGSGEPPAVSDDESTGAEAPADNPLVTALVTAGFLEFQPLGDSTAGAALPASGARLVLITDAGASLAPAEFILPLIGDLASTGPVAAVLATGLEQDADPETRGEIVDLVRQDPELTERLSTVDSLERFEGWAALVLSVEVVADGKIAHFGLSDTASRLLPALEGPT